MSVFKENKHVSIAVIILLTVIILILIYLYIDIERFRAEVDELLLLQNTKIYG